MSLEMGLIPNRRTRPRLKLAPFVSSAPPPPPSVDYYSAVADWGMYLNNTLGDCTCAEVAHQLLAASTYAGVVVRVTNEDVLALYELSGGYVAGNPATDQGAEIQVVLNDWRTVGIGGHKCVAFAEIDVSDMTEIRQAVALVGSVDIGFSVSRAAMTQFQAGQPWDVTGDDGGIVGGHSVEVVGYDANYIYVVTWGKVQAMTPAFWAEYVVEAWAVCLREWLSPAGLTPAGLDASAFGRAFEAMTGSPNPFTAGPLPDAADAALWAKVKLWAGMHHVGGNGDAAKAVTAWARAKQL